MIEYPATHLLTFVVVLDIIGGAESCTSQPLDHVVLYRTYGEGGHGEERTRARAGTDVRRGGFSYRLATE